MTDKEMDEAVKKQMAMITRSVQQALGCCPQIKDALVVITWDGHALPNMQLPISTMVSNREGTQEAIVQTRQMIANLQQSIDTLVDRGFSGLMDVVRELQAQVTELSAGTDA